MMSDDYTVIAVRMTILACMEKGKAELSRVNASSVEIKGNFNRSPTSLKAVTVKCLASD
jgi:hypothetical protein